MEIILRFVFSFEKFYLTFRLLAFERIILMAIIFHFVVVFFFIQKIFVKHIILNI